MKIIYEKHPVSKERKAELVSQGYRILDAIFDPDPKTEKPEPRRSKRREVKDVDN